jgi:hypothetical protein
VHLPERRRRSFLDSLPEQPRERRLAFSPKRLVAVLTPVAAVLAVVLVVTTNNGSGERAAEPQAVPAAADLQEKGSAEGQEAAAPPADEAPPLESAAAAPPALELEGPPAEIARVLVEAGFDARVENGAVVVTGAEPGQVRQALFGRPRGGVPVYVR